jgi:hypothetical protein
VKVAICLTGHMRNYEDTFSSLKRNVLEKCECDVFIHTYKSRGWTLNSNRSPSSSGIYEIDGFDKTSPEVDVSAVFDLYTPVKLVVEKWDAIEPILKNGCSFISPERYRGPSENPMNIWSQWRKWYLCLNDVMETGIDYDYIIRYRPDMYIDNPISFPYDDCILTPEEHSYGIISDIFSVGKMDSMKRYLSIYQHAKEIYNTTNIEWNPHVFLLHYLNSSGLKYQISNMRIHK